VPVLGNASEHFAMATRSTKQYVTAALWMLAGLAGAVGIFATIGNQLDAFRPKNTYQAEFELMEGAAGLKPGSPVRVGGQDQGRVERISFDDPAFPTKVFVEFSLPKNIRLYKDPDLSAVAAKPVGAPRDIPTGYDPRGRPLELRLEQPILGSGSVLNVVSVGWPKLDKTNPLPPESTLADNGRIRGVLAPGLLAQAGLDKAAIDRLKAAFGEAQELAAKLNSDYEAVRTDVRDSVKRVSNIVEKVEATIDENRPDIRATISAAPGAVKNFNDTMDSARRIVADVEATMPQWRDNITQTLADTRAFVGTLNPDSGKLYKQVTDTVEQGRAALASFETASKNADTLLGKASTFADESIPELRLMVASARLASDQLKLTLAEVRRNPWKLLYQPSRKELQQDLLFMASRNYADAVSELRGVTASLESISATSTAAGRPVDAARAAELRQRLTEAFASYQQAEKELLDRLVREQGK